MSTSGERDYSGPTKRSADVGDYVSLEADLARAKDEDRRLREEVARLRAELARSRALASAVDPAEVARYASARDLALRLREEDAAACQSHGLASGHHHTSVAVIDASLEWTRRAVALADAVAYAHAKRRLHAGKRIENTAKPNGRAR